MKRNHQAQKTQPLKPPSYNKSLVEALYEQDLITFQERKNALSALNPRDPWKLFLARLLMALGGLLVISGIVYFVAFNWAELSSAVKLISVQSALVACLIGSWALSLKRLGGKICLLIASIFVGIFLATFGQIYQTDAQTYKLFMAWALLILGWTLISQWAVHWMFFLLLANLFFLLFFLEVNGLWAQAHSQWMLFLASAYFNGTFLALREHLISRPSYDWLRPEWIRMALLTLILTSLVMTPISTDFVHVSYVTIIMIALTLVVLYAVYRYQRPDIRAFSAVCLASCIVLITWGLELVFGVSFSSTLAGRIDPMLSLLRLLCVLGLFFLAMHHVRHVSKTTGGVRD